MATACMTTAEDGGGLAASGDGDVRSHTPDAWWSYRWERWSRDRDGTLGEDYAGIGGTKIAVMEGQALRLKEVLDAGLKEDRFSIIMWEKKGKESRALLILKFKWRWLAAGRKSIGAEIAPGDIQMEDFVPLKHFLVVEVEMERVFYTWSWHMISTQSLFKHSLYIRCSTHCIAYQCIFCHLLIPLCRCLC